MFDFVKIFVQIRDRIPARSDLHPSNYVGNLRSAHKLSLTNKLSRRKRSEAGKGRKGNNKFGGNVRAEKMADVGLFFGDVAEVLPIFLNGNYVTSEIYIQGDTVQLNVRVVSVTMEVRMC